LLEIEPGNIRFTIVIADIVASEASNSLKSLLKKAALPVVKRGRGIPVCGLLATTLPVGSGGNGLAEWI
jgi:hypothetical protein